MTASVSAYLLGQAQKSFHDVDAADHPKKLMSDIALAALLDAGIAPSSVDAVGCVDPLSWTYPDLARSVAADIGCQKDVREFWLPGGGTTPQDLTHEIALAIDAGEINIAVIFGAEAMRTRRKATRAGKELDWPARDKSILAMRGQKPFTSEWEAQHGLRLPIQSFPILENAMRAAGGRSAEEQISIAANLLHKNALVAESNPHAWFQNAPSVDDISEVTTDNRMISYPYTKRMNAIMDVDQAAAVVIVSDKYLEASGKRSQAAAILGGAGAEEIWNPMQRRSLSTCIGMEVAFEAALASAGVSVEDIDAFDFYSCFPVPVELAIDTLEISTNDPRPFSITGGLAYGGGPGNNYVMHSLATAVQHLRDNREELIMITGVGMANTKHTATILAAADKVPSKATGKTVYRLTTGDQEVPVAMEASGTCTIATYTIEYNREGEPTNVIYILDTAAGERAIANARHPATVATELLASDPIGRLGELSWDAELGRQFFALE